MIQERDRIAVVEEGHKCEAARRLDTNRVFLYKGNARSAWAVAVDMPG